MAAVEKREVNPFVIDETKLADEWLGQANLTREAGRREADARHAHAQAKARLDVISARLKLQIRRHPEKFSLSEKPTVDQVETTLIVEKEYQEALDAVNVAKRNLDYATADTNAFLDRRKALERLVELASLNMWSEREPRPVSAGGREVLENRRRHAIRGNADTE